MKTAENSQTHEDVYLLHPVIQSIVSEMPHFVWRKEFVLLQKIMPRNKDFGKFKIKFNNVPLPPESPFNATKRQAKANENSLQYLIQNHPNIYSTAESLVKWFEK